MAKETLDLLVEGGNAKPGPTTAPKLSQFKINMSQLFNDINDKTKEYKGMNVPVKIDIENGSYSIRVGVPPVASLIKKEMGVKKFGVEKKESDVKVEAKPKDKKGEAPKEDAPAVTQPAVVEEPKVEKKEKIIFGNLTIDQAIKIAKMKRDSLLAKDMKKALKEVVGACASMPITVEGKNAKDVLRDIDSGLYDNKLKD